MNCHVWDVHKRKILPIQLPCALGFDREPSEAGTAMNVPVHQHTREKLGFSSVIIGTFLSWGASTWRMRLLLAGNICALGDFQKHIHNSPTAAARENGAQTQIHVCVCVKHTDSKREQDHEEGGQQNSRW